jgi:Aconitase A
MKPGIKNSYRSLKSIKINGNNYKYYSLKEAEKNGLENISNLPKSLKVLFRKFT